MYEWGALKASKCHSCSVIKKKTEVEGQAALHVRKTQKIHFNIQGRHSGRDLNGRRTSQFTAKQEVGVTVIITGVEVKNDPPSG